MEYDPTRGAVLRDGTMGMGPCALEVLHSPSRSPAMGYAPLSVEAPLAQPTPKRVNPSLANGRPSRGDTFDPIPALVKYARKPLPIEIRSEWRIGTFRSPFKVRRHGTSGIEVSEIISAVARQVGDSCLPRFMSTDFPNRGPSLVMMNTGTTRPARSSSGSRLVWSLGSENCNLLGFLAHCPSRHPIWGGKYWRSAFLPVTFQGTHIDTSSTESGNPISRTRSKFDGQAARHRHWALPDSPRSSHAGGRPRNGPLAVPISRPSWRAACRWKQRTRSVSATSLRR